MLGCHCFTLNILTLALQYLETQKSAVVKPKPLVPDSTPEVREHLRQTAFHDRVDAIMQKKKPTPKKLTGPPKKPVSVL